MTSDAGQAPLHSGAIAFHTEDEALRDCLKFAWVGNTSKPGNDVAKPVLRVVAVEQLNQSDLARTQRDLYPQASASRGAQQVSQAMAEGFHIFELKATSQQERLQGKLDRLTMQLKGRE
jgi:hypothetical protein